MTDRARLAVLAGSHGVDDFYQGAVPALVAVLVSTRSYGYAAASGITFAATLLSSVVQPVFGVLTDRRELPWLVPLGMATAGVGVGLAGLVDAYAWTWVCVALSGLGVAAYHPQAAKAAGRASRNSATGMSWFTLGGNLGYALGPALTTPLLLAVGLGGTPLLAVPAVVYALALVARESSRSRERRSPSAAPAQAPTPTPALTSAPTSAPTSPRTPSAPDRWPAFTRLTLVVALRSVFFFGVSTFLALWVVDRLGLGTEAGGLAVTVLFGAGVVGTVLGGRLADRYGRVRTLQLGYLLSLPGLVGLLLAPGLVTLLAAVALLGLAIYLPVSVQVTLGQEYLPNRIGTASGVTLGLAVSAGGVTAPLLGLLADARGLPLTLSLLTVLLVAALLLTRKLPETRRAPAAV